MKRSKRLSALLMAILITGMLLPVPSLAADRLDLSHKVSLTISYQEENAPLSGALFSMYLVATLNQDGELTTTKDFAQYPVHISSEPSDAWKGLASTLEAYVLRDQLAPVDSSKTTEKGTVDFPASGTPLTPGLYLVLGEPHEQNGYRYEAVPFMVLLPSPDSQENVWNDHVSVNAKHESSPIPGKPGQGGTDTVNRKVLKVWKDDGQQKDRPKEVVIQLLQDGKVYETVTLNANNNWRYTWTGLDNTSQWKVVEKELSHYTVEITQEGITFVVTNTYTQNQPSKPDKPAPDRPSKPIHPSKPGAPITPNDPSTPGNPSIPSDPATPGNPATPGDPSTPGAPSNTDDSKLPQTGQLWWPVPVFLATGVLFLIIGLMHRRGDFIEK